MKPETRVILASQSARRKEIMSYFTLPFEQRLPQFAEDLVAFHGDPAAYTIAVSKGKATSLAAYYPATPVLAADTTVCFGGKVYNKPESLEEAIQQLQELSGRTHSVFTGCALRLGDKEWSCSEETQVEFHQLSKELIEKYTKGIDVLDKAGSYAIQGAGSLIVKRITGCYYNVMGLPVNSVRALLLHAGIDLWNYLR